MTLFFIEGFEHYGSSDGAEVSKDAWRKWGLGSGPCYHMVGGGRYGGRALAFYRTADLYCSLVRDIGFNYNIVAAGFGIKPYFGGGVVGAGPGGDHVFQFCDYHDFVHLALRVINLDFSEWRITRGDGTDLFTYTGPPPPNWSYFEIKTRIHDISGTLQVKLNGTVVCDLTGQYTVGLPGAAYGVQRVKIMNGAESGVIGAKPCRDYAFDDFYIAEDFVNNAATSTINMLRPTGDTGGLYGAPNWIPNSGFTNYNRIVEQPCDDDATYLYSEGAGARTLCTYEDIPPGAPNVVSGPINAMALNVIVRDTGAGAQIYQVYSDTGYGASMIAGQPRTISGSYQALQDIFLTHAQSGNQPFTVAKVNGINAGVLQFG